MEIENFDVSPFLCGVIGLSLLYAAYKVFYNKEDLAMTVEPITR